jgi:hypothetical protein
MFIFRFSESAAKSIIGQGLISFAMRNRESPLTDSVFIVASMGV